MKLAIHTPLLALLVLLPAVAGADPLTSPSAAPMPAPEVAALIDELGLKEAPRPVRDAPSWRKPRRVVVRSDAPARLAELQLVAPGVELVAAHSGEEAASLAVDADAVLGFCDPAILSAGRELRWIQLYAAGAGPCASLPGIRERGILLTNMQRISSPEIAEHVLAMLLAFTRGLDTWLPMQRQGRWDRSAFPPSAMRELRGRTLMVVGLGGIGTAVAERASALGMRVVATRASAAPGPAFVAELGGPGDLLSLAATADVVVNCTPLLPSTRGIFNAKFFAAMKAGGYFINVGRGASVQQDDLLAALKSGRLAGAGLDVTDPEPLPADDPLWQLPNVIITPHVAAVSDRVLGRVFLLARENLRRYVAGERMLSVVDIDKGY